MNGAGLPVLTHSAKEVNAAKLVVSEATAARSFFQATTKASRAKATRTTAVTDAGRSLKRTVDSQSRGNTISEAVRPYAPEAKRTLERPVPQTSQPAE
jgi:hypothetical protein